MKGPIARDGRIARGVSDRSRQGTPAYFRVSMCPTQIGGSAIRAEVGWGLSVQCKDRPSATLAARPRGAGCHDAPIMLALGSPGVAVGGIGSILVACRLPYDPRSPYNYQIRVKP